MSKVLGIIRGTEGSVLLRLQTAMHDRNDPVYEHIHLSIYAVEQHHPVLGVYCAYRDRKVL
jgi:hypothetical protein